MCVGVAQHQVLDDEFDIDQAALVVLEVEQLAPAAMRVVHLLAHFDDFGGQLGRVAFLPQHLDADRFEMLADRWGAGRKTGPGEGLVLPGPCGFELILAERVDTGHQQAGVAIGSQAQVRFVEDAGGGLARQPIVDALGEPRIELHRVRVGVVEKKDDV